MQLSHRGQWLWALLLLSCLAGPTQAQVPPDTADVFIDRPDNLPENHSPRGALWRAAALPGWGQYYNRQYLKIPIAWAGVGGLAYAFFYTNDRYFLYRNANRYAEEPENYPQHEDAYQELVQRFGPDLPAEALRRQREKYRRYRDLAAIGGVLLYGLTIVDAYVSAHLLHFDVSEDLSVAVEPRPAALAATVRLSF